MMSYDLRALEGAEDLVRRRFGKSIVGGSGGSLDVCAPAEVHRAIEEALVPPTPAAGLFFNDGSDGEIRSRVENLFDTILGFDDVSAGP